MSSTKRAQEAKKRALIKIEANIKEIYANKTIKMQIAKFQKSFGINGGLYSKHKDEIKKIRSLNKLTKYLIDKWVAQMIK